MKGLIRFMIGTTVVTLGGLVAYGLCLAASFLIAGLIGARGTNHIISGLPVLPAFAIWIWLSRWRSGLLNLSRWQVVAQSATSLAVLIPVVTGLVLWCGMDFDF